MERRRFKLARVTGKGQTTIPKAVREQCGIHEGDVLAVTVENGRIVMSKVEAPDAAYLRGLDSTLGEWSSPEDDDAYRDL